MTKVTVGSTATKAKPSIEALLERLDKLESRNTELEASLAAKATSGRTYATSETPVEVAKILTFDQILKLYDSMVLRVPGSPVTETKPFGDAVLEVNKGGQKQNKLKPGVDREHYIKIRRLLEQMEGSKIHHRKSQPISEAQYVGILCPALDHLKANGLFSWSES